MKRATYRKSGFGQRLASLLRWSFYLLLLLALLDAGYLAWIWPDWQTYQQGSIQQSTFIRDYAADQRNHPEWPGLDWNPVALNRIPQHMQRAVIVAEDSRFYSHGGIDWEALGNAMQYNLARGRLIYGGSTISQQTAKNLFLSASRNPLRKWHELVLTLALEHYLSKRRILEHYLNVAQFGHGLFGVDAAARYYWGIPASSLSKRQAIELAASLPSPMTTNPAVRNRTFLNRVSKITRHFRRWASD
jgi:monofunctional biosynthetic peptidoglycan transglycosylase